MIYNLAPDLVQKIMQYIRKTLPVKQLVDVQSIVGQLECVIEFAATALAQYRLVTEPIGAVSKQMFRKFHKPITYITLFIRVQALKCLVFLLLAAE